MSDEMEALEDGDSDFTDADEFEEADLEESLEDWGGGELEAAYLKALSALEASEAEIPHPDRHEPTLSADSPLEDSLESPVPEQADRDLSEDPDQVTPISQDAPATEVSEATPVVSRPNDHSAISSSTEAVMTSSEDSPPVTLPPAPGQIIEACLFVGGAALPAKRLSGILRGEFDTDFIEREIDSLNRLYAAENRPYEIRMGEGGYRLALREEFEKIRFKVYGLGPKEVRLSQDALEVLAVVAYHQPIKQVQIEELGKPGCGPILRQLVRRELIAVERDTAHPRDVSYKTTSRFLSLFDIRSLDELPRPEQVAYK